MCVVVVVVGGAPRTDRCCLTNCCCSLKSAALAPPHGRRSCPLHCAAPAKRAAHLEQVGQLPVEALRHRLPQRLWVLLQPCRQGGLGARDHRGSAGVGAHPAHVPRLLVVHDCGRAVGGAHAACSMAWWISLSSTADWPPKLRGVLRSKEPAERMNAPRCTADELPLLAAHPDPTLHTHHSSANGLDSSMATPLDFASCATYSNASEAAQMRSGMR